MKKYYLALLSISLTFIAFSQDTTIVRIHDNTDMTWYGNYDEWGVLPDGSSEYRKINLHYTMGCATNGCSDWDYTTQIFIRHRTGEIDSSMQTSPLFTSNGNIVDTLFYSDTASYVSSWNTTTNSVDSILTTPIEVILFNDPQNPTMSTDTMLVYEAGFYNMIYDSLGNVIDSLYSPEDSILINSDYNWYQIFDVIENYELARVITPYGNSLSNNWKFTSVFDITDFAHILQDSVEIRCHYSGWSSGFSATLDFEFIEGVPPRKVTALENIYKGSSGYQNSAAFENNYLTSKKVLINQNSVGAMIKMTTTGHGFDNNQSAAEFKPINYYVNIDGVQTHTQYNWDDKCGENPIYPQGGTWIYDRANWCPGTRAESYDHEITNYITSGDSTEIDIDFQAYNWSGTQTPSYIVECQLFQYEDANFVNSAEVLDIIKPSIKDEHSRKNPICGKPLIKIRNYGKSQLTTLDIEYGVIGGTTNTFSWTGNLDFLETAEVELPNLSSWDGSANVFFVELKNPNGQSDDYIENNYMQSEFENVPIYPETFALWVGTNGGVINNLSQESETSWDFYDDNGNTVYSSGSLYSNTQYRDTLTFLKGCYTFVMEDSDEDGLDFWANNDGGGMVRFREIGASWLKAFNADFGSNIIHQFFIENSQEITNENLFNWKVFPNPTNNQLKIHGHSEGTTQVKLSDNLGRIIIDFNISEKKVLETLDLKNLKNGIYFIEISNDKSYISKKIIKY